MESRQKAVRNLLNLLEEPSLPQERYASGGAAVVPLPKPRKVKVEDEQDRLLELFTEKKKLPPSLLKKLQTVIREEQDVKKPVDKT